MSPTRGRLGGNLAPPPPLSPPLPSLAAAGARRRSSVRPAGMAAARPTLDGVPSLCVEDGPARGGESDDAGWRRRIRPPHGWIRCLHAGSGRSKLLLCGVNGRRRWQRLATRRLAAAGTGGRRARKTQWRPAAEVAVAKADSGGRGGGGCDGQGCAPGSGPRLSPPTPCGWRWRLWPRRLVHRSWFQLAVRRPVARGRLYGAGGGLWPQRLWSTVLYKCDLAQQHLPSSVLPPL